MEEPRTIVGTLDNRGILPILEMALAERWTGELRVKHAPLSASMWIVNGQIVHSLLDDAEGLCGSEAFAIVTAWQNGEYFLQSGTLPPERSLRVPTDDLLAVLRGDAAGRRDRRVRERRSAVVGRALLQVFDGLRERVPGLESLSLMRGNNFEATTSHDADEIDWMELQLKSFFSESCDEPDTLYLQEGAHSLLLLKRGRIATVLSARPGTAPEALFWAGAEAQRRVLESAENLLISR